MRHVHYDERAGGRVPGYNPLTAYFRLVVGVLGAVALTTVLWAAWAKPALYATTIRRIIIADGLRERLGEIWGINSTGNIVLDSLAFAFTRLTSPFVLGTLVVAGLAAYLLAR